MNNCTCRVHMSRRGLCAKEYQDSASICQCSLHKAAADLLSALKGVIDNYNPHDLIGEFGIELANEILLAVAKAEGR